MVIEVLNLGAGVQSSTVLLMSIRGQLPKLDHAVFADTGWEPAAVYQQLTWLEGLATEAGIKVHRVSTSNIKNDALVSQVNARKVEGSRWASLPLFVLGPDGEHGQIRRQCTYEYKIRCIELCLRRQVLGLKPRQRAPREPVIRQWYGISQDEWQRQRTSDQPWSINWYPLLDKRMTRTACYKWLHDHGYHEPPKSACIGCPYRSNRDWRKMKEERPEEWAEAVAFDAAIRNCNGMRGQVFIHADRVPLDEAKLWNDQDEAQQMLPIFNDECSGMCGV